MAEQLELFPDTRWIRESNQKRIQLGYLLQVSENCVDERLVLEAWQMQTGEDVVATVKQQLSARLDCRPDELLRKLRDRKLGVLIAGRVNLGIKKLTDLSVPKDHLNASLSIA
jgi:hypothetical protein